MLTIWKVPTHRANVSSVKRTLLLILLALTACSGGAPNIPSIFASATPVPPTATPLPPTSTPIPLAISINGQGLTADQLKTETSRYTNSMKSLGKTVSPEQALKAVEDDLVSQFLLAEGAKEAGFVVDDNTLKQRVDALGKNIGGTDPQGTAKLAAWEQAHGYTSADFEEMLKLSIASAWMRDKIMSSVPLTAEQVHVRQILLYNEDAAKNYYSQLQAGTSFEELAAQVDPVTHGDIGWFPRGYLSEKTVEDAAFSLQVGAYSPIVSGEVGFHIIKLMENQPARALSPDALNTLQSHAVEDWLANRRKQSSIEIHP